MARTIAERIGDKGELYTRMLEAFADKLRVAMPGTIRDFDPITQTATVKPAIREKIRDVNLNETWTDIPDLLDVPIVFPSAGGFSITFPIKAGDECLIVFSDMCIDAWHSYGGTQNQIERRRHDLSDAFAIMGVKSQPRKLTNYNTNSLCLKNDSDTQAIEISQNEINIRGTVKINGQVVGT